MQSHPDIDNLIYRARHGAPCLIKSDLMRLILDMASALEFCKSELSFAKDKLGAANRQLFQGSSEAVPEDKKSPKPAAEKPALSDFEEESKKRLRDLRAEAWRLARDLKEQSTPAVDKMAHKLRTAKIPQGIICPECRGEIKDQGKYREAVEIDVHPSRFVKRTVNLHKGSCSCGGATLRMPAPIRATEGSKI